MAKKETISIKKELKQKYVAFLDVLGFSEMVNSSDHTTLDKYFNTIQKAFLNFDMVKAGLQKLSISDSIILIAEDEDESFASLLTAIQSIQTYLAFEGIWLRGAISFGDVCYIKSKAQEGDILVGRGYIKAYKLEAEAKFPRVIIDPAIIKKQKSDKTMFSMKYNIESDGVTEKRYTLIHEYFSEIGGVARLTNDDAIFVNYANRILLELWDKDKKDKDRNAMRAFHDMLRDKLYSNQLYYEKFLWLRKYFTESLNDIESTLEMKKEETKWHYFSDWITMFNLM